MKKSAKMILNLNLSKKIPNLFYSKRNCLPGSLGVGSKSRPWGKVGLIVCTHSRVSLAPVASRYL